MKITKKQLAFIIPLLAVTLVLAAGYIVNTLTLTVGVKEAFEVEYAILGDGGTYEVTTLEQAKLDCVSATYFTPDVIDTSVTDTMLPGQSRFVCVKIYNEAGELPYTITSDIVYGDGSLPDKNQECLDSFGEYLIEGIATASNGVTDGETIDGFEVVVADDAAPITNCMATIDVARG